MSPSIEAVIMRAARFLIAGVVEPDECRAGELQRVAANEMLKAAQLLSGHMGDQVPAGAVLTVRNQVLSHVRDHFQRLASTMAPALLGVATESEAERAMREQFAASSPVKQ
jgi:hypothetical protein